MYSFKKYPLSKRAAHQRGFTIIEIVIVVTIIGTLAAIAVPAFKTNIKETRASVVINDLRVFSEAFSRYNIEQGTWPPTTSGGSIPPGMTGYLADSGWTKDTPYSGKYAWFAPVDIDGDNFKALIAIADSSMSVEAAEAVDEIIDDGNTATGSFRISIRNYPVLVFEE